MNNLIRQGLYTGVGTIVIAKEKFKEFVEELIQNNELTKEEGRRVIQTFIHQLEDGKNSIETNVINRVDDLLLLFKLPSRNEIELKVGEFIESLKNNPLSSSIKKPTDNSPVA